MLTRICFALLVSAFLLAPVPAHAAPFTVTARRLLDVQTGRVVQDPLLRIEDGVIISVGTRTPGAAVTHDLGDVTLLPGLIDCHVHLVGGEELTPYEHLRQTTARAAIEGVANARKTLLAGFTTVRDLGSRDFADVALRDAIAAGRVPGPRMLVAVRSLSPTGGHGDHNDLPPDVRIERYSGIADGPEEVRRKVRENLKHGADWIKLLVTGGVMSAGTDPTRADYTLEEIRAAVAAARERGRDVAAHAHGAAGIARAAEAGARSIEHASMLDDAALAAVRKSGAFLVMNPYTNHYILERGRAGGYQPYQIEKSRAVFTRKMESLGRAIRAGLQLAYGTDAGVQPHGVNGRQLRLYVQAGMTPLMAIQSATLVAARLLRLERRVGQLQPGFYADLIGVRGDPLRDVGVLGEAPAFVMKGGVLYNERP
jgi:imidazolonepropionase-like amidohydrolase